MLLLECLEVRKDIFRLEQPGTLYIFALVRGLKNIFAKLLVSFDCMLIILVPKSEKWSQ